MQKFAHNKVRTALEQLIATRQVNVFLNEPKLPPPNFDAFDFSSTVSKKLFEDKLYSVETVPVASRIAGTQFMLSLTDRLCLSAIRGTKLQDLWAGLQSRGIKITGEGGGAKDEHQFTAELAKTVDTFREKAMPSLFKLGVLTPV
jgi:hypothetical protein